MTAIFFLVFAGVLGIINVKTEIFGIEAVYWCMVIMAPAYLRYLYKNRRDIKGILKDSTVRWLIAFEICGAGMAIVSFLGFNAALAGPDLIVDRSFIPRHAIYLYFIPAVIVMAEPEYRQLMDKFLSKCGIPLFWIIYLYTVVLTRSWSLNVPQIFVLALLHLYNPPKKTAVNWLMFAMLMLTPITTGGELTNGMLRALYAVYFVFGKKKKQLTGIIAAGVVVCLTAVFVVPFFADKITPFLDANSAWRIRFWNDELVQLVQSKGLGVGFGTSYATKAFVGNQWAIPGSPYNPLFRHHTKEYMMMVTGPHNSFISVAFRMGVAGIVTFLGFLASIFKGMWKNIEQVPIFRLFVFFAAIAIISVNVGLENPGYLIVFVFAMAMADSHNPASQKLER